MLPPIWVDGLGQPQGQERPVAEDLERAGRLRLAAGISGSSSAAPGPAPGTSAACPGSRRTSIAWLRGQRQR